MDSKELIAKRVASELKDGDLVTIIPRIKGGGAPFGLRCMTKSRQQW